MKANLHPNTQAMLEKLTPEQCEEILNTKYTASDIKSQMERLEEIKAQLRKPGEVTIVGWVLRDDNNKIGIYREKPTCDEDGWDLTGEQYDLFPDITPDMLPKKYRITITPME